MSWLVGGEQKAALVLLKNILPSNLNEYTAVNVTDCRERIPMHQETLQFQLADGSARDRRIQLARAIGDLRPSDKRLGAEAKLLALLVFDMTADGIGTPWAASDEMVMGHALGPACAQTKFDDIRKALEKYGILSVDKRKSIGGTERIYSICWDAVYRVRGLPLPESLAAKIENPVVRESRSTGLVSRESRTTGKTDRDLHNIPACARVDLILDDDEEPIIININSNEPVWESLEESANRLVAAIYEHTVHRPSLGHGGTVFLASVALLGETLSRAWIASSIEGVREHRAKKPPGYLRTCLRNGMAGHVPGGSPELCDELLARVQMPVSRWVSRTGWSPDSVVEKMREAAEERSKAWKRGKSWHELTEADKQALREEAKATGSLVEMARKASHCERGAQ